MLTVVCGAQVKLRVHHIEIYFTIFYIKYRTDSAIINNKIISKLVIFNLMKVIAYGLFPLITHTALTMMLSRVILAAHL